MSSVNVQRANSTTKIYDKFYNFESVVSTSDYDYVYSFFKSIILSEQLANEFTAAIFKMSQETGITAQKYIESVKGQDEQTLTLTMAYYLNQVRSNSTLLGIGSVVTPNYYAARNVLP